MMQHNRRAETKPNTRKLIYFRLVAQAEDCIVIKIYTIVGALSINVLDETVDSTFQVEVFCCWQGFDLH